MRAEIWAEMNLGGQVQDIQYMIIESNEIGVLNMCLYNWNEVIVDYIDASRYKVCKERTYTRYQISVWALQS